MFEQSIVSHNAGAQNIYNVFYFITSSVCIFKAVKKQSGIEVIVNALFGYFAYIHSVYTIVEQNTNFVLKQFARQSFSNFKFFINKAILILFAIFLSKF